MKAFYEALVAEGFEGSYDTVRRYNLRLKAIQGPRRGYIPLEFDVGDALQFEWSHEVVTLGGIDTVISPRSCREIGEIADRCSSGFRLPRYAARSMGCS